MEHLFNVTGEGYYFFTKSSEYPYQGVQLIWSLEQMLVQGLVFEDSTVVKHDSDLIMLPRMVDIEVRKVPNLTCCFAQLICGDSTSRLSNPSSTCHCVRAFSREREVFSDSAFYC